MFEEKTLRVLKSLREDQKYAFFFLNHKGHKGFHKGHKECAEVTENLRHCIKPALLFVKTAF